MASFYIQILALQRPFPFNTDDNQRVMFSVNFEAMARAPVNQFEEEIVKVLTTAGLATLGTDTFIGPLANIPTGAGPYTSIIDTGGAPPLETQNSDLYEQLSVQIIVRATSYSTARTRALAVWRALDGVRNSTVAA